MEEAREEPEPEPGPEQGTIAEAPEPWRCRKRTSPGIGVTLADGNRWELARAGLGREWNHLAQYRDHIFDEAVLTDMIRTNYIRAAAVFLLRVNYDIDEDYALALVCNTPAADMGDAVAEALVGVQGERKTCTAWMRATLICNGIAPEGVHPDDLPHVLEMLVLTGRAIHAREYTDAGVAAEKRASLMNLARRLEPAPNRNGVEHPTDDLDFGEMEDVTGPAE